MLQDAVRQFELSLQGLCVLTEAASGPFIVTPLLAGFAGARKVYALTRDSRHGSADTVAAATRALAGKWGLQERIEIVPTRDDARIGLADIVTNLGFVRPIDAALIERFKPTVAIPLMWETWEFRSQDLDLDLCRAKGIPVLGTNEHHPNLRIFAYLGHVALKLLYELGIEVYKANAAIVGSGEFAIEVKETLSAVGARPKVLVPGELATERARDVIRQADALIVLEHHDRRELIGGAHALMSAEEIRRLNPAIVVAHVCGGTDQGALERAGLRFLPPAIAPAGFMSVSTAYVGPRPVIELHAAGLRVGQALAEAVNEGLRGLAAERRALERCAYAQGFQGRH